MIKIGVNGAKGKMGSQSVAALSESSQFQVVFTSDKNDSLVELIEQNRPEVVLDFTQASVGYENAKVIIEAGVRPVIGTSGFQDQEVQVLKDMCQSKSLGGLVVPNFSISAVLMMKYCQDAAKYFSEVEIIEYHHQQKEDAPSGTSIKTAELIRDSINKKIESKPAQEVLEGSRGADLSGIKIHAVRLPGYMADQEVIFGSLGQTFKISSYTNDRQCYMPGVILACKKALEVNELLYGLENVLK